MRLHDAVASATPFLIQTSDQKVHRLPGAAEFSSAISTVPVRYALDDAAAVLVSHTAYSDRNMVDTSLDLLRFPSTEFWVEWNDAGRSRLFRDLVLDDPIKQLSKPGRVGAYVRTEPCGRKGNIAVLWENDSGEADLTPYSIDFDFDDPESLSQRAGASLTRHVHLSNSNVLQDLYGCAQFRLSDEWLSYYEQYSESRSHFEQAVTFGLKNIASDFPFLVSFCLMMSARGALAYKPSALDKLNAKRTRIGKEPLLDHVMVSLALDAGEGQGEAAAIGSRNISRLHHVCGHLVRRGSSLHWRRAHMRGDPRVGVISARTVQVKCTAPVRRAG